MEIMILFNIIDKNYDFIDDFNNITMLFFNPSDSIHSWAIMMIIRYKTL